MKKLLKIALLIVLVVTVGCEDDNGIGDSSNTVRFQAESVLEFIEVGGTKTASVMLYTGNVSGSDRTVTIGVDPSTTLDPAAYSVPTSVTIPGGTNEAVVEYQITDTNISLAGGNLVLAITDPGSLGLINGSSRTGQSISIAVQYEECPPSNSVVYSITMDTWPDETTWSVTDAGGNVLDSGGPYINPDDDFATFTFNYCLESGVYTLTVNDAFGDGGPSFTVVVDGVTVIDEDLAGTGTSVDFTVD